VILAIQYGDKKNFQWMIRKFEESNFASDQVLYLSALSTISDKDLVQSLLQYAISGKVRSQDLDLVITRVALQSSENRLLIWNHINDNIDYFKSKGPMDRIIKAVMSNFGDIAWIDKFLDFFESKFPVPSANRAIAQSMEKIAGNHAWKEGKGAQLYAYLLGGRKE
jgi:hypothetical protein